MLVEVSEEEGEERVVVERLRLRSIFGAIDVDGGDVCCLVFGSFGPSAICGE